MATCPPFLVDTDVGQPPPTGPAAPPRSEHQARWSPRLVAGRDHDRPARE